MTERAQRHLERVDWSPNPMRPPNLGGWPFTIPAVAQLVDAGGIDIAPGVTFIVGENGSGKSTLVEAIADVYPRRGFEHPHESKTGPGTSAEDSPLRHHLRARTHPQASPAGFFLRAELMHSYLAQVDARDPGSSRGAWDAGRLQARSHGESFLAVLDQRFADVGVYFMDEPEAALSFQSCLGLVALLAQMREEGSQVIVATHSPLLMSLPGAHLLEVGDWGYRELARWEDADLVQSWRSFLDEPGMYLRHLVG
ncbi:MAG TPA: AAA family ATPase [Gaiellales bacterium]|nr:AAA family ATPase [Gaiellales bacterium]